MEAHLCHGPGGLRGKPLVLGVDLVRSVHRFYELDGHGRRRWSRAALFRGKGSAKSELASALAVAELLGPVRSDGWNAAGQPVGRPVVDPFIRVLATEEGQATLTTYRGAQIMCEYIAEHHGDEYPGLDPGITRTFYRGGGEIRPSTAASASRDGGRETFFVADESHLYVTDELRAMFDTVSRNTVKRADAEPWWLTTTTMFSPGQGSIAEDVWNEWQEIQAGKADNRGLLVDWRGGPVPEGDAWDDDEVMLAALGEAYADAEWVDLKRVLAEIRSPRTTKAAAARYFLCQSVVEESQWVDPAQWERLADRERNVPTGTPIALGFDGSSSDDATALIGCTMLDEVPFLFVCGIWERPEYATDWEVPRAEVAATVEACFLEFQVAMLVADPPYFRSELSSWAGRFGDQIVVEYPTNQWSRFSRAVDRMTAAIVAGTIAHDGDEVLARHVANAKRRQVNERRPEAGFVIVKDRKGSSRKIDCAVAACLALEARDLAIRNGWRPKVTPRIWTTASAMAAHREHCDGCERCKGWQ
jgi:phage terminase large subunit-like protein